MLKRHTQVLTTVLRLLDMSLAFTAWELAYHLRFFWVNLPNASMIPSHSEYLKAAIFVVVLTGFVFSLSGIYSLQKVVRPIQELYHLIKGTFTILLLSLLAAFFYRDFSFSRVHTLYFLICFLILLFISRLISKVALRWLHNRGAYTEHILLIGNGITVKKFIERLNQLKSLGIVLKGVVETNECQNSVVPANIPRLGKIDQLNQIIQANHIDQVFIALSLDEQHYLTGLKELLAEQWVDVKIIPELGTFRTLHTEVESFDDMPIITIIQSPMSGWNPVSYTHLTLPTILLV